MGITCKMIVHERHDWDFYVQQADSLGISRNLFASVDDGVVECLGPVIDFFAVAQQANVTERAGDDIELLHEAQRGRHPGLVGERPYRLMRAEAVGELSLEPPLVPDFYGDGNIV